MKPAPLAAVAPDAVAVLRPPEFAVQHIAASLQKWNGRARAEAAQPTPPPAPLPRRPVWNSETKRLEWTNA